MPLAWFEERVPYLEAEEPVTTLCSRRLLASLHPAELLQTNYIVPDLGHVADLFALELYDVDVVRIHSAVGSTVDMPPFPFQSHRHRRTAQSPQSNSWILFRFNTSISQMESSAFINTPCWDGANVLPTAGDAKRQFVSL